MLQVAIYCGIPASLDGFRVAREALLGAGAIEPAAKTGAKASRKAKGGR